ncbi:hypothetical protein ACWIGM_08800 [Bosea sp. NPDC055332]
MLRLFPPKTEPPLDVAMRKITEASASLNLDYSSFDGMWTARIGVSRKDRAYISFSSKQVGAVDAICGVALKLMRERL